MAISLRISSRMVSRMCSEAWNLQQPELQSIEVFLHFLVQNQVIPAMSGVPITVVSTQMRFVSSGVALILFLVVIKKNEETKCDHLWSSCLCSAGLVEYEGEEGKSRGFGLGLVSV